MSAFDQAFQFLLGSEGGFSMDPKDPGNWTGGKPGVGQLKGTKFGIAANTYPKLDIANLTVEQAKAIYKRDYWDVLELDGKRYGPALVMFDCAVNQGVGRAKEMLAKVATSKESFTVAYQAERMLHYASLSTWPTYGRGWSRRLLKTCIEAQKDV